MKKYIIITCVMVLSFTGCTQNTINNVPSEHTFKKEVYPEPSAAKYANFKNTMMEVALSTKDDAKYNKMKLDTPEKKAWFKDLMYRLWDRQITRHQFMAEGLAKYPTHRYEFAFVANGFQKRS